MCLPTSLKLVAGRMFRRGFFDLYEAIQSPTAKEAIERIDALYAIETAIRGESAEVRLAMRQKTRCAPTGGTACL